jgi:NADPH-dependent 7-cyano-7-deazaguanine reductase QueF-like protein
MLISQLIQKLEKLKSEKGDLPVYYKDNWTIYELSNAWVEQVDEDQADYTDLEVGQPIAIVTD